MTKFKSHGLYIIRIKYWNASGSGNPPSLISALRKIAILGPKNVIFFTFFNLFSIEQTNFKFLKEALVTVWTLMSSYQNQIDESFSDKALSRSMFNDLAEM